MKHAIGLVAMLAILTCGALAQEPVTFTGTALIYGSGFNTRTTTRTFTLRIKGVTSDSEAANYLNTLQERGQDALLDAIRKNDLGNISLGAQIGRTINAVRIDDVGGKKRIRAVLERWIGFGELRGGYRSVDYPFGYIELLVDPRTGKGEGTFIPAAKIRFRGKQNEVEIEDFGTYPGRLMSVTMRGRLP
jgi:hypothetical protein